MAPALLMVPPCTLGPDHAAVMALIDAAEDHAQLGGADAAYLRAGVWAVGDDVDPHRSLAYRRHALRVLATERRSWEPDSHGHPVLDGEVGQVVRYLAGPEPAGQGGDYVERAWDKLCAAVDEITGVVCGVLDPVDILGPGVHGSVQDKTEVLLADDEEDAKVALSHLLRQANPQALIGSRRCAGVTR
jgi:hypothetical protein